MYFSGPTKKLFPSQICCTSLPFLPSDQKILRHIYYAMHHEAFVTLLPDVETEKKPQQIGYVLS